MKSCHCQRFLFLVSFVCTAPVVSGKDLFNGRQLAVIKSKAKAVSNYRNLKTKHSTKSKSKSKSGSAVPSALPSALPSASSIPSSEPSGSPSQEPTAIVDLLPPRCEDVSFNVLFKSFQGIASDLGEDVNDNEVLDAGEDFNGDGKINAETGISAIDMVDSFNLVLDYSFNAGDQSVVINAYPADSSLPANGTINAIDGDGKSCSFDVNLIPVNESFLDEIYSFPSQAHKDLFGQASAYAVPVYFADGLAETPGEYLAVNESNETFSMIINEIIPEDNSEISREILESLLLPYPELSPDEEVLLEDIGFSVFTFNGTLEKDLVSVGVVAYAYTTNTQVPTYSVVILSGSDGILFDEDNQETNFADIEVDEEELLNNILNEFIDAQRSLQGERNSDPKLNAIQRNLREESNVDPSSNPIQRNLREELNIFQRKFQEDLNIVRRNLQPTCRESYLDCDCGTKFRQICVQAAKRAFREAVRRARQAYNAAIAAARAAYNAAKEAARRWLRRQAAICILACAIGGPLFCAACAARAAAAAAAAIAAAYLIFELAQDGAFDFLQDALDVAGCAFEAAYYACQECKPCDEKDRDDDGDSKEYPDPHFRMWNREIYDFHGECDMIHVTNEHLDLHMRTESRGHWSAVSQVALRFDNDVLEVFQDSTLLVNGVLQAGSTTFLLDEIYSVQTTGSRTTVFLSGAQKIIFQASGSYGVTILIDAHGSDFFESVGMAGTWNKFGFNGRDGLPVDVASMRNAVEYAVEWEVNSTLGDPVLLSTPAEHKCIDVPNNGPPPEPTPEALENADKVCGALVLDPEEKENCVFDVLIAGEESVENNTAYTEPFESTERCVAAAPEENGSFLNVPPTCADLGGMCVFRCDESVHDCLQNVLGTQDPLCVENTDLTVVDGRRRRLRRMQFIEGCSCRLPKQPSESPSISSQPSESPSDAPSSSPSESSSQPSQSPTVNTKKSKKSKMSKGQRTRTPARKRRHFQG